MSVIRQRLHDFRVSFNKLHDNTKSIIVFTVAIAAFVSVGMLTSFSWVGIVMGCIAAYLCGRVFCPVESNDNSRTE